MAKDYGIELQAQACSLVKQEVTSWQDATAFVTPKIAFNMRNLVETARKNYYGIFDEEYDPITGQKKIWFPLTEFLVESAVKNIDLDLANITFRTKPGGNPKLTSVVRATTINELERIGFGEKLDDFERRLAIDGTSVWSTEDNKGLSVKQVELLNFYIDPSASSIAETPAVIERLLLPVSEAKDYARKNDWINVDEMASSKKVYRSRESQETSGETPMVEIYKRTGLASKAIITGKKKDADILIPTRIYISGTNGKYVYHYSESRKDNEIKGYQEAWYTRVPGRWHGRGIPEKVMMLQLYQNIIGNVRKNRAQLSQLGIFKVKNGSGLSSQSLSRIASNGVIKVNSMDDLEQMVIQDIPASSYKDEDMVKDWAQRVTQVFESATGESLPSSMPATNAAIQSRSAQGSFSLIKEGIGMFLQRWLKTDAIPIIFKYVTVGDVVRLVGDDINEIREFDENQVNSQLAPQLQAANQMGIFVDPMQVENERRSAMMKLSRSGRERFVTLDEPLKWMEYDVAIDITNESFDKGVMVSNLTNLLSVAPQYAKGVVKHILDLMGLSSHDLEDEPGAMPTKISPDMAMNPEQAMQQQVTASNTLNEKGATTY